MVDIHTHVIPFVDDGSRSLEESIEMIKHELEIGVDTIICTPHYIYKRYEKNVKEIKKNFEVLKEEVTKQGLKIKLFLGQEIYYTHRVDVLGMLKRGELLTLNDSNRVLLEFSFTREPEDFLDVLYDFSVNGYQVIIAHIERYKWMNIKKIKEIKSEGALIQVNCGSIIGNTNWKEKRLAKKAIKFGLVDFIASDVHSFRPSLMDKALKIVKNADLFNYLH